MGAAFYSNNTNKKHEEIVEDGDSMIRKTHRAGSCQRKGIGGGQFRPCLTPGCRIHACSKKGYKYLYSVSGY